MEQCSQNKAQIKDKLRREKGIWKILENKEDIIKKII